LKALRGFLENLHQQHQQLHQNDQVVDDHVADEVVNDEVVADDAVHVAKRDLFGLFNTIFANNNNLAGLLSGLTGDIQKLFDLKIDLLSRLGELKSQVGLTDTQARGLVQAYNTHKREVVDAFINHLRVKVETLKALRAFLENLHRHKHVVSTTLAPATTTLTPVTTTQAYVVDVVPSGEGDNIVAPSGEGEQLVVPSGEGEQIVAPSGEGEVVPAAEGEVVA